MFVVFGCVKKKQKTEAYTLSKLENFIIYLLLNYSNFTIKRF